jgi:hypothetical protein
MNWLDHLIEYLLVTLIILLLATGCASFGERPVEYVPFEVKVVVETPCAANLPAEPAWATKGMPRVDPATGANIDVAVDKLTAEREQRKGYEAKLKAAVEGCR